ncbi:MAG: hypothetical protein IJP23_01935 [Oscillospiraceae bacterium]|nr:hypothetical protein [Oscillospiraceae bacterium]
MKKRNVILIMMIAVMLFAFCACGADNNFIEPPAHAISYETASSSNELVYTDDGDVMVILKVDMENLLTWNCSIEDESCITLKEQYMLKSNDSDEKNIYHIFVFDGLKPCEEVKVNLYKTDKDGNTGFNGERIFAMEVFEDLTANVVWGRLVVRS